MLLRTGHPSSTFDVTVTNHAGEVFWDRMRSLQELASMEERQLAPGDSVVYMDDWPTANSTDQPVSPGIYGITGRLRLTGDTVLVAHTEVQIRRLPRQIR
jgi:hypothetical protein